MTLTYNYLFPCTVSSLLFVIEAVFVLEKTSECRFGALLEIKVTFRLKLNVFS